MACHLFTHEAQWITWPISWKQIKQCLKPLDRNQPFKRLSIDIKRFNYCFDFYFLHNPNIINVAWWLILIKFPGLLVTFFLWNCNLKSCKMSPNLYFDTKKFNILLDHNNRGIHRGSGRYKVPYLHAGHLFLIYLYTKDCRNMIFFFFSPAFSDWPMKIKIWWN